MTPEKLCENLEFGVYVALAKFMVEMRAKLQNLLQKFIKIENLLSLKIRVGKHLNTILYARFAMRIASHERNCWFNEVNFVTLLSDLIYL